ncbi:MAG: bifunctional pyr operon transcriptional regulator/uracil phosphoribosyltransferase PyrR [Gemmatimonadota bacterium]|jgi:pyrimidine operon attenuation protein/uracil phosphoribosyltransferase|nr:MAG: bifunctional pyr operon transcriptional regulator/uracil phosphoribosyltransferase PyrR [Gemmatimonadota bacterium]
MSVVSESDVLLDAEQTGSKLRDLALRMLEREPDPAELLLVGIRRRGVELAERLAAEIEEMSGLRIPTGSLDITLYRDDFGQIGPKPVIGLTELPVEITDRHIIIVDDVLHTGRTTRAALNELSDFGRPRKIELCVLVDRGGRELPIQPDYLGLRVDVAPGEEIAVSVPDTDGELAVRRIRIEGEP